MSISIHIPFYNPNPEKKEGYRNLTRFDYLKENILNLKKLSIKNDIFIHTHNNHLDDKNLEAKIIKHEIDQENLEKGYLTWLSRPMMEKQKNDYEYFMYLEHDIKFTEENLQYWFKYQTKLSHQNFHLGFLIYEKNHNNNQKYSVHLAKKLDKFINLNHQKYIVNDWDNYCCFWIYNKKQFHNFLNTKWWSFKKKLTNFRHNYGITERSALGLHAFNINYFKATLIPEKNNQPDPRCFIEHITNNYFQRFSDIKDNNFLDIRGVCRFNLTEVFEIQEKQKEEKNFFVLNKFFKNFRWKFRFISRKLN
tara:strand:- start:242 stop:1162 length:921 start_codon:yes stop_codon:yes gene_type:complete